MSEQGSYDCITLTLKTRRDAESVGIRRRPESRGRESTSRSVNVPMWIKPDTDLEERERTRQRVQDGQQFACRRTFGSSPNAASTFRAPALLVGQSASRARDRARRVTCLLGLRLPPTPKSTSHNHKPYPTRTRPRLGTPRRTA